ncbi:hypothetical protein BD779DRAFT_867293 [Infundibulicybe gibba]|nr:hypothetical protein BD779DRAFT_867293 [Infundibulicybe gibba]
MHLYLSDASPLHATFGNEEGQAIYKVDSPFKLVGRTANISRVVPNDVPRGEDMQDRFAHLAQVEWHTLGSSIIRQAGQEVETKTFFQKEGLGWDRVFMAPDGKEYRWELGLKTSTLVTNDKAKTRVARFHRKHYIFNRRPASLEIYPGGEEIMDTILVTFIYVEKIRKDAENASKRSHGGGP